MKGVLAVPVVAALALSILPAYAQTDHELLGSKTYTDSADNFHIVGEIKNTTNRTWRFVQIAVPLLDADDRVIAAPTGSLFVEYLRPGESGAFHIIPENSNGLDAAVAYAVHVNYLVSDLPVGALEVVLGDVTPGPAGATSITGEVKNTGNITATYVQVSAALYDMENNLIDTTVGFTDDILAGESASFALVSGVRGAADVERVSLNVYSREYAMVPEFPLPLLTLLGGLAAVMVAKKYR